VAETGSTNADVAAAARAGEPEGLVLVAESQTTGRGRLNRTWHAPPRSGLMFSLLLRPENIAGTHWSWAPLLVGVAANAALRRLTQLDVRVKWPNDLLIGDRKVAGILVERVGDALVVGMGLNVTMRADELPTPSATSLALAGATITDRDPLLRAILREIAHWYAQWRAVEGDPEASGLRTAYHQQCATLGQQVRIELPEDQDWVGEAVNVDAAGRLLVRTGQGEAALSAGDVIHVRAAC